MSSFTLHRTFWSWDDYKEIKGKVLPLIRAGSSWIISRRKLVFFLIVQKSLSSSRDFREIKREKPCKMSVKVSNTGI